MNVRRILLSLLAPTIAVLFSVGVAAIALLLVGVNPWEAFSLMWDFGTTSTSVASMINRAIPLYVSAVAVAIGFKMGLFNIGVEGQFTVAALFAGPATPRLVVPARTRAPPPSKTSDGICEATNSW